MYLFEINSCLYLETEILPCFLFCLGWCHVWSHCKWKTTCYYVSLSFLFKEELLSYLILGHRESRWDWCLCLRLCCLEPWLRKLRVANFLLTTDVADHHVGKAAVKWETSYTLELKWIWEGKTPAELLDGCYGCIAWVPLPAIWLLNTFRMAFTPWLIIKKEGTGTERLVGITRGRGKKSKATGRNLPVRMGWACPCVQLCMTLSRISDQIPSHPPNKSPRP